MKITFAALCLILSCSAFADNTPVTTDAFVGSWEGQGTYVLQGDLYGCDFFKMVFTKTDTTFTFAYGRRNCLKHSETFETVTLNAHDGGMFYVDQNGKEIQVGTFSAHKMTVGFDMPDPKGGIRHWEMSMRADGDNLMYEERRIMNDDKTPMISFAGMALKK